MVLCFICSETDVCHRIEDICQLFILFFNCEHKDKHHSYILILKSIHLHNRYMMYIQYIFIYLFISASFKVQNLKTLPSTALQVPESWPTCQLFSLQTTQSHVRFLFWLLLITDKVQKASIIYCCHASPHHLSARACCE